MNRMTANKHATAALTRLIGMFTVSPLQGDTRIVRGVLPDDAAIQFPE